VQTSETLIINNHASAIIRAGMGHPTFGQAHRADRHAARPRSRGDLDLGVKRRERDRRIPRLYGDALLSPAEDRVAVVEAFPGSTTGARMPLITPLPENAACSTLPPIVARLRTCGEGGGRTGLQAAGRQQGCAHEAE